MAPSAAETPACQSLIDRAGLRQPGPVFLASYPTVESGPLRDAAYLYDNAVAAIALVACGRPDKAARIGDAMLAALDHDRFFHDGRLRNAYLAGPVAEFPVKLPGWWEAAEDRWVEDGYQVGSDTGNQAWAMLALVTLAEATKAPIYLAGAERLARHVEQSWSKRRPAGFDGGTFGPEPSPARNRWKSTEHNTDLAAAFARLSLLAPASHWAGEVRRAQGFVAAMWRPKCRCFAAGTAEDGHTRNNLLVLDAQIWPLLALGTRPRSALVAAELRLRSGDGFSYGEAGEGIWTEGTAGAALAMSLTGREAEGEALLAVLYRNRAPDGSYYATEAESLPTGFRLETDPAEPRLYFRLPHLGALAWAALAQTRFNPFTGTSSLPPGK